MENFMKFNETILGSIIIGTLIGGAILISSAVSTGGKPKIKVMSLADGDRQEQVIHKEVIFDMNSNSEMEWNENSCLLYTSPSPRDRQKSRMPSSA